MKKQTLLRFTLLLLPLLFLRCGSAPATDTLIQKEEVKYVDLRDVIEQTGEIQPVVKVELKSESSGKIDTIYVREGERLKKGQRILKIDPVQLVTEKEKLDLSIEKAKLNLSLAKRDYDNALVLKENGSLSQQKLEDLKSQFDLKAITLKEIELDLHDVEYKLSKTLIVSPMDGVLISLLVEVGEIAVSATSGFSGGTAIGTVADVGKLEVVTQIGEVDYNKIKNNQGVVIRLESDSRAHTSGKVNFISQSAKKDANGNVSNFEVRAAIDSLIPGLVPGVNVSVDFIALEKKHVVGVPFNMVEKIKRGDKETFVVLRPGNAEIPEQFRMKDEAGATGKKADGAPRPRDKKMEKRMQDIKEKKSKAVRALNLKRQRIILGLTDYNYYEVLEGLSPGDTVVKLLGQESPSNAGH